MEETKQFLCGDEAVAVGVKLSRPRVIAAYPITPQTIVVERLSEFVEEGSLEAEYLHVESEHSAMAASMGAIAVGARVFTATSSQGLLYMSEGLFYASGSRFPIVMMNANRAVASPWSIYGDQSDSLSQLNSGWIQVYVEDAQEALDMVIQAYKIAENPSVLTPVMINLDGFVLTHTYELVEIPDQRDVDSFLPPYESTNKFDLDDPKNLCIAVGPAWHTEIRAQQHQALVDSAAVISDVDREFGNLFGRYYGGLLEEYRTQDAEVVLVTLGSVTGTVRMVVDKMREEGHKVGLVKLRYIRPFPRTELLAIASRVKALGVLEKDVSYGYEGTVFTNVNSALVELGDCCPATLNFIAGLGGRDITKQDVEKMFTDLLNAARGVKEERVQFSNLRWDK